MEPREQLKIAILGASNSGKTTLKELFQGRLFFPYWWIYIVSTCPAKHEVLELPQDVFDPDKFEIKGKGDRHQRDLCQRYCPDGRQGDADFEFISVMVDRILSRWVLDGRDIVAEGELLAKQSLFDLYDPDKVIWIGVNPRSGVPRFKKGGEIRPPLTVTDEDYLNAQREAYRTAGRWF